MRACFRLKKLSNFVHKESWEHAANYVAKCYMDKSVERERYFDDVRLQMDAKLWAEIFNRHNPPKKIDMFQMSIVEFVERDNSPLYHLEHFIEGEYIKYNSNSGFVDDSRSTPQAFSHFTFECSNHQLMVVDIQGVGDLYTDPQIHTARTANQYGDANLGCKGFALFFSTHVCNRVCRSLGLTEFDLAPNQLKKVSRSSSSSTAFAAGWTPGTVCRGAEEFVIGSPTSFCEILRRRVRNMSTCSDDLESEGYESSSSSPISPLSLRPTNATKHFRPRPSCVFGQKQSGANCFHGVNQEHLALIDCGGDSDGMDESILGQVHLEMARYHEMGRFVDNTSICEPMSDYDHESAFFHLKQAAELGVKEALITLAKIYLQLPHDLLCTYSVEESEHNFEQGFDYLSQCADLEDKHCLFLLAEAYESGVNLPKTKQIDWNLASVYYKKLLQMMEDEAASEDAGYSDSLANECEANYLILARLAQMNLKGGHNMPKNESAASALYTEAADKAIQYGKGRIANKYYMLAEEAAASQDQE
ncbi:eukaryotic elongation factor 2 kinase isoform X2 [Brachionus plicatilis]|uniref:Eukaryotic elongation factor 2 kinase isoform X2 n=1 Tax=Brachionus plicatilis TaxID=10195 RepID=A0A3M7P7N8_BRAPC|nr:eukaryotic elongation factor 2 kinase isoform X2 [Brachionus plicatilis]